MYFPRLVWPVKLEEEVAFQALASGNFPSHRRSTSFAADTFRILRGSLVVVVRLAGEMGVVNFGKLSIDRRMVRASASKCNAMSYGRMLEEERRLAADEARGCKPEHLPNTNGDGLQARLRGA